MVTFSRTVVLFTLRHHVGLFFAFSIRPLDRLSASASPSAYRRGDLLRKVAMEPNQRLPEREVAIIAPWNRRRQTCGEHFGWETSKFKEH